MHLAETTSFGRSQQSLKSP